MTKSNTKKKRGLRWLDWLLILGFLIGACILLYPTASDMWNQYRNRQLITSYSQAVENLTEDQYDEIWAAAREYNASHTVNTISSVFDEDYILGHPYDSLLNPSGDEIMGSLEIPKINVTLAIYHGIGEEALEQGCGHMEGTSLPIGGAGTHAVLAAHRGLPSAKLFTDLDQIETGDMFYIKVLDETLAYEVDQIKVVLPDEIGELAIQDGEDYVTLVTCTPYGVNTHRLLVRGRRTAYVEETEAESTVQMTIQEIDRVKILMIGLTAFLILMIVIGLVQYIRRVRRKSKS